MQVDPFDENSPIKQAAIEKFPPDMFFVLRVVQLLRGMANGEQRLCMCMRGDAAWQGRLRGWQCRIVTVTVCFFPAWL